MKAHFLLTLILGCSCLVAGALAQTTQSELDCYIENAIPLAQQHTDCALAFGQVFQPSRNISDAQLQSFCSDNCARVVNDFLMERCRIPLVVGLCSIDNNGFCAPRASEIGASVGAVIAGPCLGTTCGNSTVCNAAVQNLTCCVDALARITEFVGVSNLLPTDCVVEGCPNTLGGASMFVAMPLVIILGLLLVVL